MQTQNRTTQDQVEARVFLNEFLTDPECQEATLLGYAGTGKTWLIGDWLAEIMADDSQTVAIAAPTHKALDVLRQKCGHLNATFKTLHSLLGLIVSKNDEGGIDKGFAPKSEQYTLLVVDEGSMVGKEFKELIDREIASGGYGRFQKVLYVGDPAQLPPVKEEQSPIFLIERSFTLRTVVRYDSAILNVATFLRTKISEQTRFTLLDLMSLKAETPSDRSVSFINRDVLYRWAQGAIAKELDCRILAWTNAAVLTHNVEMHRLSYPNATSPFMPGEKILLNDSYSLNKAQGGKQRNDDEPPDSLYNGEVLTCESCVQGEPVSGVVTWDVVAHRADGCEIRVSFAPSESHRLATHKMLNDMIWKEEVYVNDVLNPRREELVKIRRQLNKLAPLRHAYSCTVHKSQGSTYDVSIVDFGDVYRCDDRARLMYVAATRPSKFLVLSR